MGDRSGLGFGVVRGFLGDICIFLGVLDTSASSSCSANEIVLV